MAMNKFIILLFLAVGFSSCITINMHKAVRMPIEKQGKYKPENISLEKKDILNYINKTQKIYLLDKDILKSIVNNSSKEYFLIIGYNSWCASSTNILFSDILPKYGKKRNTQLILVCIDDWMYKKQTMEYLKMNNYKYPSFMLDMHKYGYGFNLHNKFIAFAKDLSPSSKLDIGLNAYLLIDKNLNIISEGIYSVDETVKINSIIN